MICANPECGRELVGNMLICRSNGSGGSCRVPLRQCPGLRFCSSSCVSACWRSHNQFPQIQYITTPAIDEDAAAAAAEALVQISRLDQLWGKAA